MTEHDTPSPQFLTGWHGSVSEFVGKSPPALLDVLSSRLPSGKLQKIAWGHSITHFQSFFQTHSAQFHDWWLIFEYELPLEGGRRPDLVILTRTVVFVVEIKDSGVVKTPDIEQAKAYTRDIREYHHASQSFQVQGILLVMNASTPRSQKDSIEILNHEGFNTYFLSVLLEGVSSAVAHAWIHSAYAPLPTLIASAKLIFDKCELPQIKSVENSGVNDTIAYLKEVVARAKQDRSYHLVLIGGVPGSGKTLVGLQFVHEISSDQDLALYLSGNQPLVKVLQDYLGPGGKTFIREVRAFIDDYWVKQRDITQTNQHIVVFDEAQRAWDADRVFKQYHKKKYQSLEVHHSEPALFVQIMERHPDWAVIVGLIGDGQEIHIGEEGGLVQWKQALISAQAHKTWVVHLPARMNNDFQTESASPLPSRRSMPYVYDNSPKLELSQTLRSHAAIHLHQFTDAFLAGQFTEAKRLAAELKSQSYGLYLTDTLALGMEYLKTRYREDNYFAQIPRFWKTYGIIASSWAKNLREFGINVKDHRDETCFCTRFFGANDVPRYYNYRQSRADLYCAHFKKVAREFDCQGLELDGTLLAWGSDYRYDSDQHQWVAETKRAHTQNPALIRQNAYRVLLTRARDGIVVFCPSQADMASTFKMFAQVGFESLSPDLIHQLAWENFGVIDD